IENARLFSELGERNRALSEALEQQTATADVLRVISASPTNQQRVFDTIVASVRGLLHAGEASLALVEGETFRRVAVVGETAPEWDQRARSPSRKSVIGRVLVDRRTLRIDDLTLIPADDLPAEGARRIG